MRVSPRGAGGKYCISSSQPLPLTISDIVVGPSQMQSDVVFLAHYPKKEHTHCRFELCTTTHFTPLCNGPRYEVEVCEVFLEKMYHARTILTWPSRSRTSCFLFSFLSPVSRLFNTNNYHNLIGMLYLSSITNCSCNPRDLQIFHWITTLDSDDWQATQPPYIHVADKVHARAASTKSIPLLW